MQLLISCPKCQTSYQIDDQQVNESDGQARCYHCGHVFNAMLNAQPVPSNEPGNTPKTYLDDKDLDAISSELSSTLNDPDLPATDQEPDSYGSLENSSFFISSQKAGTTGIGSDSLLNEVQDNLADTPEILLPEQPADSPSPWSTLGWSIGILTLLLVALLQTGWHYRQILQTTPQTRELLESACEYFDCTLPPRKAPQAFAVVEREIKVNPKAEDVLNFNVIIVNNAAFEQPAPHLQLSLFDNNRELIARRSFTPADYLGKQDQVHMIGSGEYQKINLNLVDPGQDVTGFELSFF